MEQNGNGKSATMSLSRMGTPADNPLIESFHSTLKSHLYNDGAGFCCWLSFLDIMKVKYK
ncbi:transposase InsO family protein [Brevibacillus nitrificans]|nr:transposase InsO family protein [Brevibacillus nitrificans]